jgi:Rrf2 family protein
MKINKTTDYAIRIISGIYESEGQIVTSNSLAQNKKMPHGVLMKVIRQLRDADFVKSHQGRGEVSGGYSLNKPVDKITILDIVELMEGKVALTANIYNEGKGKEEIEYVNKDKITDEYDRISNIMKQEMGRFTLYDIFNNEKYQ